MTRAARGGQATVYRAWLGDRPVAVKVYHRGLERAAMEKELMEDIARDDPGADAWVLTILGSGTLAGRPFLVLPWVEGSFADWVVGRPLHERVAALVSATEAVARLHRSRRDLTGYRVHRDIKPDNLLVGFEGGRWVVRLADLGAAKAGASVAMTTNTAVLTEAFAPPEQALPLDQEPRESWDVHALAVTIYWGLTGRMPIVALDAPGLVNEKGRELIALRRKQAHASLSELDGRRLEALRRARPELLLDLEDAVGWREEDTAHLHRVLQDAGVHEDLLVERMVDALGSALHPDGRLRSNDVRKLLVALKAWAAVLPEVVAVAPALVAPPPARDTLEPATWAPSSLPPGLGEVPEAPRRRGWVAVLVVLGAALVVVGVGGGAGAIGLWRTFGAADPGGAPAAAVVEAAPVEEPTPVPDVEPPPVVGPGSAVVDGERRPTVEVARTAVAPVAPGPARLAPPETAPTAVEPPAPEMPPMAEPVMREIRVRACANEPVQVSVDGRVLGTASGPGSVRAKMQEGARVITWTASGMTHSRSVAVGERTSFCHAFVTDGCTGTCVD